MKKKLLTALMVSCIFLAGCGKNTEVTEPAEAAAVEQTIEISTTEDTITEGSSEAGRAEEGSSEASSESSSSSSSESSVQEAVAEKSEVAKEASAEATTKDSAADAPTKEASEEQQASATEAEPSQQPSQEKKDYGRIIFIGDSRTVDIFDGEGYEVYDRNEGGVRVFAENGRGYDYMMELLDRFDEDYDSVITWLGCNDHYNIEQYKAAYEALLARGINLVICNVGPTVNENLDEWDSTRYRNEDMAAFNQQITAWANAHGVKVIDMYSFVYANLQIDSDGIHYSPKPTYSAWNFIMNSL